MKTVFITGAASGIGLITAQMFAKQGYFVGLYDINLEGINALLASEEFPNACGGFCDVTDTNSIKAALADFAEHTDGVLDVLINNAGIMPLSFLKNLHEDEWEQMIDVNIKGALNSI